jgi:hypothetical protein
MAKLNTITTPVKARFRFVQDASSHWYAIPAEREVEFERWYESFEEETDAYDGPDFTEYRLSMHPSRYSFCNLQED